MTEMYWGSKKSPKKNKKDNDISMDSNNGNGNVSKIKNNIYFYDAVNRKSILELNRNIRECINMMNSNKNGFGFTGGNIDLHIMSYGGGVLESIGAVDFIKSSPISINTFIDGYAASAATLLSIVGDRRYMTENSFMLIHELSSGFWGKYKDFQDEIINLDKMMSIIKKLYKDHTNIPMKKLEEILKHDLWLTSDECLKFGLVDEVI